MKRDLMAKIVAVVSLILILWWVVWTSVIFILASTWSSSEDATWQIIQSWTQDTVNLTQDQLDQLQKVTTWSWN